MPRHLTLYDEKDLKSTVYVNGALMPSLTIAYVATTVNSSGKCVFPLVKSDGTPIFKEIYVDASSFQAWGTAAYQFQNLVFATDKKSASVDVKQITVNLGALALNLAATGIKVTAQFRGQ